MTWHYWHKRRRWKMDDQSFHEKILRIIGRNKIIAEKYLDIGCDGKLTSLIADAVKAKEVFGIDPSEYFLDLFTKNVKAEIIKPIRLDLDNDAFPLSSNSLDLVTCLEIVEHLLNPDNVHRESFRILKPGGYYLVSAPNISSWYNRFLLLFGFQPVHTDISSEYWAGLPAKIKRKASHHGHIATHTYKGLKELLQYHGFKVISSYGFSFNYRYRVVNLINRVFEYFPSLADGMIILAQKPLE